MRDHEHETKKDGAQGRSPLKARKGGENDPAREHPDGPPAVLPDILGDARAAHPANAEPLAELLSRLQHSHGNAYVQRVVSEAGGEKAQETQPAAEPQRPPVAQGLDAGTLSLMESAFGESFGDVRVHTGGEAERMNEELGARAVTRGRDVYFDRGEYDPATAEGRELLAHELAHVVQQSGEASRAAGSVNQLGDKHEQEADRAARVVLGGGRATILERGAAPAYQREAREGGQQKAPPGAINLAERPSGPLAGGASYTFDASSQRLTITGPQNLSVQPPASGGSIVFDSARASAAPGRTRTVIISVSATPLNVTVNGQPYIFVRLKGAA
jgi:hypothetical protein